MKELIAALFIVLFALPAFAAETAKESVYDRVIRTGTIRCGYLSWAPFFAKDVNTSAYSGVTYDIMEEIARELSLKVEWVEEVSHAAMFEGYKNGRYDLICVTLGVTPARARESEFTSPLFFMPEYFYARADDHRFDNNFAAANDPNITYAAFDGEFGAIIAKEDFPNAKYLGVTEMGGPEQLLMSIAAKKADVTATEPVIAINFEKSNPGQIHRVPGGALRTVPLALSIPPGEERLKAMINTAVENIVNTGFIDKVLKKYPDYDSTLVRVASPYRASAAK
jgi:ABC-type amino acid transport substrate-binding protein